jgi:hypothetical protein
MSISNDAAVAAADAMSHALDEGLEPHSYIDVAKHVLEAAAPHLMAAAFDEGEQSGIEQARNNRVIPNANPYRKGGSL